jgi:hypothetical protein
LFVRLGTACIQCIDTRWQPTSSRPSQKRMMLTALNLSVDVHIHVKLCIHLCCVDANVVSNLNTPTLRPFRSRPAMVANTSSQAVPERPVSAPVIHVGAPTSSPSREGSASSDATSVTSPMSLGSWAASPSACSGCVLGEWLGEWVGWCGRRECNVVAGDVYDVVVALAVLQDMCSSKKPDGN